MRTLHFFLLCAISALCTAPAVFAGAWTQPANSTYIKTSIYRSVATEEFSPSGRRRSVAPYEMTEAGSYNDVSFCVYSEHGASMGFTFIATAEYKTHTTSYTDTFMGDQSFSFNGVDNIAFGVRAQIMTDPFALAFQGMILPPLSGMLYKKLEDGLSLDLRLAAGTNLPIALKNYIQVEAGFLGNSTGSRNNAIPYRIDAGVYPIDPLLVRIAVDGEYAVGSARVEDDMPLVVLLGGELDEDYGNYTQEFTRISGNLTYALMPSLSISLEGSTIIAGKNQKLLNTVELGAIFNLPWRE